MSSPPFSLSSSDASDGLSSRPEEPLDRIIEAMEQTPLSLTEMKSDWNLEDIDLICSMDDWWLVVKHATKNGRLANVGPKFSIDADDLLRNFSHKSPALRLISAAIAAHNLKLPEKQTIVYYKRARKAIMRSCHEHPTIETVQAFYFLYLFALWKGQPSIGRKFLLSSLQMIKELQLDIDPDDSPNLATLQLTQREKEGRRRAFWASYWSFCWEQAVSPEDVDFEITARKMKPPNAYATETQLIFARAPLVEWDCQVCSLLWRIKRLHSVPPPSIAALFVSQSEIETNINLISVHSRIPPAFRLYSKSYDCISREDYVRLISQLQELGLDEVSDAANLNLYLEASVAALHRPKLFLASSKSCKPMYLTPENHMILTSAINQTLQASHRILCLFCFFLDVSEGSSRHLLEESQRSYFSPDFHVTYALFESFCVFWFILCRMDAIWWPFIEQGDAGKEVLAERLNQAVAFVKRIETEEGSFAGTMKPLVRCMESMEDEINRVLRDGRSSSMETALQEMELGMTVMSLGDNVTEYETKDPYCFLGLLGMEVGGGLRWKGRSEESWKLFWKLNS
ncbi:hypothetical protein HDU79_010972 [Rhizoclosmatium sp. JEL0117]|nr:hypothetical protein HDU79_010972 [Rhizoclosmatium sp. JEL0117]